MHVVLWRKQVVPKLLSYSRNEEKCEGVIKYGNFRQYAPGIRKSP